ncbi:hypothetical protein DICSQDRAFT_164773 [Dichomitus squalens LYAD-421 SS1]|uniref:uncharacterized protein n=1 Tax=Dichomitus squalens (strain LYAD-421) TaxID=732165 RepID=UPI0004415872|nr:uncharacterized protein DICSQDRAFT_164773 [Dichomitus squalens LYAD-421 SS1]EJF66936.1 hypothetical protein DICSQDRAFT_164773 [Dichomitus squalens LYAD-421 SS1]
MAFTTTSHHLNPRGRNSTLRTSSDPSAESQTRAVRQNDPEYAHGSLDARSPTPTDGPVAAALPTPHDAVLAELQGLRDGGPQAAHKADASSRTVPRLSVIPSVGSLERTERTATPSAGLPRSATSTPGVAHEQLYDPFSGNLAGVMVPRKDAVGRDVIASQFDQRRDELWARLSSIRELQSEVASLHVQMEGIGLNDVRGGKRTAGVGARMHSDTIPVAEEWDEPDGAADALEEQRKRARDAEFTNLAETFKGRREAIDAIMNKLGDLSEALTTFHDLPTPVMDFSASRCTTKDSMPLSPEMGELRSPSIAASPSPELPPVLPKFVLSEAEKGVFHESPVAAAGELPPHASPA